MSKPKEEVKNKEYYKEIYFLYEIIGSLKNIDELKLFLKDILTSSELRMVKRRWHIATLLAKGLDIRDVAFKTKTSTTTVSKIKKIMEEGRGGLNLALERSRAKESWERKQYIDSKRMRVSSKFVKGWFR